MFTPTAAAVFPTMATRPVSSGFLASISAAGRPVPLYIETSGHWTATCPTSNPPPYQMSAETFALLCVGGTVSTSGEGWTVASGQAYRLVAVVDIAGARHGIAVAAGPSDPPV